MAHYAKVKSKKVIQVIVAEKEFFDTFIDSTPGEWIKTSYNTEKGIHTLGGIPLRKNYAVVGGNYCSIKDAFFDKQPYNSWILNEDTYFWEAPTPKPNDNKRYEWNETTTSWDPIVYE
jgi:hypothetical protein